VDKWRAPTFGIVVRKHRKRSDGSRLAETEGGSTSGVTEKERTIEGGKGDRGSAKVQRGERGGE